MIGQRPGVEDAQAICSETARAGSCWRLLRLTHVRQQGHLARPFDRDRDLYGQSIRLGFVQRLRDERKFEDVDALRTQIEADRRRAERLFAQLSV
jgi:hypothetical protein